MEWISTAFNGASEASVPVWVALITLIGTAVTAGSVILRERVAKKASRPSAASADVAIATLDNRGLDALRSSLDAANDVGEERNIQLRRLVEAFRDLTGEVEELRRELRASADALRRD